MISSHPSAASSLGAPAPDSELVGRSVRGIAWGAAARLVLAGSRYVVAVVLARALGPVDYGAGGATIIAAVVVRQHLGAFLAASVLWKAALATAVVCLAAQIISTHGLGLILELSALPLLFALMAVGLGLLRSEDLRLLRGNRSALLKIPGRATSGEFRHVAARS